MGEDFPSASKDTKKNRDRSSRLTRPVDYTLTVRQNQHCILFYGQDASNKPAGEGSLASRLFFSFEHRVVRELQSVG